MTFILVRARLFHGLQPEGPFRPPSFYRQNWSLGFCFFDYGVPSRGNLLVAGVMAGEPRRKRKRAAPEQFQEVTGSPEGEDAETRDVGTERLSGGETIKKSPVVVFAHGAGAPSSSDWMIRWKGLLASELDAVEVITFDYPYFSGEKRRPPPKAEKLVDFHTDIVRRAVAKHPGHPLVLIGKSMGSRVSCMVAAQKDIKASAIVCLGYPLQGMNGAVRDDVLLRLTVPAMFVQGNKDGMCSLEKLEAVRTRMGCINELHVVEGGDHSFKIAKKHQHPGHDQETADSLAAQAISKFVSSQLWNNQASILHTGVKE